LCRRPKEVIQVLVREDRMMWKFVRFRNGAEKDSRHLDEIYRFKKEDVILRDMLAMDRTILANERTVLAWLRTSMSMILGGISFIEFLDVLALFYVGWALIYSGLFVFVFGVGKYMKVRTQLHSMKHKA
jgi:putative membrane protein